MKFSNVNYRIGNLGISLMLVSACGDNNKSAGDKAKSATDAVVDKASDIKDAVVGKEETRAEAEAKIEAEYADLESKISVLEAKAMNEVIPEVEAANKARLTQLKAKLAESRAQIVVFKNAVEADWKLRRDEASASMKDTRAKVASALDRQKFKEGASEKIARVESKLKTLDDEAAIAEVEAKQKIEADREKLEVQYQDLKVKYRDFERSVDEKWESFKVDFQKSWSQVTEGFKGWFD